MTKVRKTTAPPSGAAAANVETSGAAAEPDESGVVASPASEPASEHDQSILSYDERLAILTSLNARHVAEIAELEASNAQHLAEIAELQMAVGQADPAAQVEVVADDDDMETGIHSDKMAAPGLTAIGLRSGAVVIRLSNGVRFCDDMVIEASGLDFEPDGSAHVAYTKAINLPYDLPYFALTKVCISSDGGALWCDLGTVLPFGGGLSAELPAGSLSFRVAQ